MSDSDYRKIFVEINGEGPWLCCRCEKPITEIGRSKGFGNVHHIDEDRSNNEPENLEIHHHECHASLHHLGHKHTPEHRKNNALARLGTKRGPHSEEARLKISRAGKGKRRSPETRKRMSEAQQKRASQISEEQKKSWETRERNQVHNRDERGRFI